MATASSGIFGGGAAPQALRATGRSHAHPEPAAAAAPSAGFYQDSAPRPRIVNGKIVRGEALASAPVATGAPSPSHATGLTWAPSPPVIRRRAADEATVAAVAYGGGGGGGGGGMHHQQYAPPQQAQQQAQQQQQYAEEERAPAPQYEQYEGGGGGHGAAHEQQYGQQQQQQYAQPQYAQQPQQQQQQRPSSSPQLPGRGTGITHSSNRFASGANQNAGNVRGGPARMRARCTFPLTASACLRPLTTLFTSHAPGAPPTRVQVLTDRPTSRVLAPPGGRSSISIG
jgi:hypothetical protein